VADGASVPWHSPRENPEEDPFRSTGKPLGLDAAMAWARGPAEQSSARRACSAGLGSSNSFHKYEQDDPDFALDLKRLSCRKAKIELTARACEIEAKQRGLRACIFGTLTSATDDPLPPRALSDFGDQTAKHYQRRGVEVILLWVAEPQFKNDCRIHYHFLLWVPARKRKWHLPMPDASGRWRFGSSQVVWARHPARYLAKYLGKLSKGATVVQRAAHVRRAVFGWRKFRGKYPPKVRTYGVRGLSEDARNWLGYCKLPRYVRRWHAFGRIQQRRRGGGYVLSDGRCLRSAFKARVPGAELELSSCWRKSESGVIYPLASAYFSPGDMSWRSLPFFSRAERAPGPPLVLPVQYVNPGASVHEPLRLGWRVKNPRFSAETYVEVCDDQKGCGGGGAKPLPGVRWGFVCVDGGDDEFAD